MSKGGSGLNYPKSWENERVRKMSPEDRIKHLEESMRMSKNKISELEQRVEHLRTSRRVLMGLLEKVEREKSKEVSRLELLLNKERKRKYMVHRSDLLWKTHVQTFEEAAREYAENLGKSYAELSKEMKLEIAGIRENAKTIREEFRAEEVISNAK